MAVTDSSLRASRLTLPALPLLSLLARLWTGGVRTVTAVGATLPSGPIRAVSSSGWMGNDHPAAVPQALLAVDDNLVSGIDPSTQNHQLALRQIDLHRRCNHMEGRLLLHPAAGARRSICSTRRALMHPASSRNAVGLDVSCELSGRIARFRH